MAEDARKELYNLLREPSTFEGLDPRSGTDVGFHKVALENDEARRDEILENDIRVRNPKLYQLLKAQLARLKK